MKAKKLYDWEFSELQYRMALAQQTLRADAAERIITLYENGQADADKVATIRKQASDEASRLERFMATVIRSNEPSLCLTKLRKIWVS